MSTTILCVEDEADLRSDIVEELRDAGYKTLEAENGKVALELILRHKPDLVISDITMPVMDGHALLKELRSNHPEKCDLPFLFLSALAEREHLVKGKKLGANDYLTKPIDYEMLHATLEALLENAERLKKHHKEQLIKVYKAAVEEVSQACAPAMAPSSAPVAADVAAAVSREEGTSSGDEAAKGLEAHLQGLVTESPTKVVAGRVQLVGLDDVKAALGARWSQRSEVIYDLIERTIKSRLAPADVYQRDRGGNFIICFASLSEAEAAFKARAIAEEIRNKILGMDLGSGSAPLSAEDRHFLTEVTRDRGKGQPLSVEGEAHEIEIAADEVAECGDLLSLLTSRLTAAAELSKKTERAMLIDMVEKVRLELHRFETQQAEPTPFLFSAFDRDSQEKVDALRRNRPASHDLVRDLDVLLLSNVIEEILRRPPGKGDILIANVHLSTLENKHRLEHFKKVCETLTDPARAALILNVVEIPNNLLPAKVAEYFFQVRHFCRAMMAECHAPALGNLDPQMLRTPVLSYNATDLVKALGRNAAEVAGFLKQLRQKKLRLLVYGIAGELQRGKVRAAGVDFLTRD